MLSRQMMTLWCLLAIAAIPTASAQEGDAAIAEARALIQLERSDIIREEIYFTASEAAAFWPVYEAYVADGQAARDRYAGLVATFVAAYNDAAVTPELASRMVDEHLAFKQEQLAVKQRYVPKFRAVLPPLKAARFYQLDNKIDVEIEAELALYIPLVDPV